MLFLFIVNSCQLLEIIYVKTLYSRDLLHLGLNINGHCQVNEYTRLLCLQNFGKLSISHCIMRTCGS